VVVVVVVVMFEESATGWEMDWFHVVDSTMKNHTVHESEWKVSWGEEHHPPDVMVVVVGKVVVVDGLINTTTVTVDHLIVCFVAQSPFVVVPIDTIQMDLVFVVLVVTILDSP